MAAGFVVALSEPASLGALVLGIGVILVGVIVFYLDDIERISDL